MVGCGPLQFAIWPSGQQALPGGHIAARLMASAAENGHFSSIHSDISHARASRADSDFAADPRNAAILLPRHSGSRRFHYSCAACRQPALPDFAAAPRNAAIWLPATWPFGRSGSRVPRTAYLRISNSGGHRPRAPTPLLGSSPFSHFSLLIISHLASPSLNSRGP